LTPTRADVEDVARRTGAGIEKALRAAGRSFEAEEDDAAPPELTLDEPGLAACCAARTGASPTADCAPRSAGAARAATLSVSRSAHTDKADVSARESHTVGEAGVRSDSRPRPGSRTLTVRENSLLLPPSPAS